MKNDKTIGAVYIYIYIERTNEIDLCEHRLENKAMYFRRI